MSEHDEKKRPPLTWNQVGLGYFISTAIGTILVLLYDLYLMVTGQEMITDYARANPWLAFVILMLLQAGVCGLAVHFMGVVKVGK